MCSVFSVSTEKDDIAKMESYNFAQTLHNIASLLVGDLSLFFEFGLERIFFEFQLHSILLILGTNHESDQPPHLTLKNDDVPVQVNLAKFGGPEGKYCPAG